MGWDKLGSKWQSVFEVGVLEAGKMGNCMNLSDIDKGLIVMARPLG